MVNNNLILNECATNLSLLINLFNIPRMQTFLTPETWLTASDQ